MKNPDTTYTNSHAHLSQNQLIRYQQEKMDDAESYRVERHLLECELCSDAVEGMELLEAKQAKDNLQALKGRLSARLEEQKNPSRPLYWKWVAAASVLLLASAVFFWMIKPSAPFLSYKEEKERKHAVESESAPLPVPEEQEDKSLSPDPVYPDMVGIEEKVSGQDPIEVEVEDFEEVAPESGEVAEPAEEAETEAEFDSVIESIQFESKNSIAQTEADMDTFISPAPMAPAPGISTQNPSLAKAPEIRVPEREDDERDQGFAAGRLSNNGKISADRKILKGKVTDSSGEPLPGVNVRLAGSAKTAVTDLEGEYSLQLPVADTALQISFIGYETKNLAVPGSATQLLAVLEEDVKSLNEVVVVGYGTKKRREVTGSVSTVAEIAPPKPTLRRRAYKKYLQQNRRYPAEAQEAQVEGVVVVEFFVAPDSTLNDFQILKSLGYGLDEEAIRLIEEGPAWEPASSGEEAVGHKARVRVKFKLD